MKIYSKEKKVFFKFKTIEYHSKFGRVHFLYVNSNDQNVNNHFEPTTVLSLHKSNNWTQEVNNQLLSIDQPPPPRIPPHLLNILLNRKLPDHV
jgi:hypothetical protein